MTITLGAKVRDTVTGYEGIAIARLEYLNGCVQYLTKPKAGKDGKMPEGEWIDVNQLEVTGDGVTVKRQRTGGPVPNAPKNYGP